MFHTVLDVWICIMKHSLVFDLSHNIFYKIFKHIFLDSYCRIPFKFSYLLRSTDSTHPCFSSSSLVFDSNSVLRSFHLRQKYIYFGDAEQTREKKFWKKKCSKTFWFPPWKWKPLSLVSYFYFIIVIWRPFLPSLKKLLSLLNLIFVRTLRLK